MLLQLAADLVRLKVDVIFAFGTPAAQAAKKATNAIPIVFGVVSDPLALVAFDPRVTYSSIDMLANNYGLLKTVGA